jgi:hypothetical protein
VSVAMFMHNRLLWLTEQAGKISLCCCYCSSAVQCLFGMLLLQNVA